MAEVWDCVVIGAGIMGSATAYNLAKSGQRTLLIDKFAACHKWGSSHGETRIMRKANFSEFQHLCMMANKAEKLWKQLENITGQELYREIGCLSVGQDSKLLNLIETLMIESNLTYEKFDSIDIKHKFPMLNLPDSCWGILEKQAGVLFSSRALLVLQTLFRTLGGQIHREETVLRIVPGSTTEVITNKASYKTRRVVLAAGPWTKGLLQGLGVSIPLQPVAISVCFWKENNPGEFSINKVPTMRFLGNTRSNFYSIPSFEHPEMIKFCHHKGIPVDQLEHVDEELRVKQYTPAAEFITKCMPSLDNKPSIVETCYYTMTPDEEFIMDTIPGHDNIAVAAGFCGHGFKHAPLVGHIMSCLVQGKPSGYDISKFSLRRFGAKL